MTATKHPGSSLKEQFVLIASPRYHYDSLRVALRSRQRRQTPRVINGMTYSASMA